VLWQGRDLAALSNEEMSRVRGREIGMIFQEPMTALNPVHRIGHQLVEAIRLHRPIGKTEALKEAIAMLECVRIPAAAQRAIEYPHQLSGGMKQRVMIAMALLNRPSLLIADEPTTALDVTVQAQILDLMRELQREMGMSLLLITHDLGVIAEMCDEVIVMYAGRIVERAPVRELFARPRHAYTRGLLASIPRLDGVVGSRLSTIPGMVPSLAGMPRGCRFCPRETTAPGPPQTDVRPAYRELSPRHWVEACPRCAA
jgi:peptide/nickel transport system ATP-binding protein